MNPYQNYQPGQNGFGSSGADGFSGDSQSGPYQQYRQPPHSAQPRQEYQPPQECPGKEKAKSAMIFGIIAVVTMVLGYVAIISVVLGIVGLVMASKAKAMGYTGGEYTAAKVLSIVALVGGSISVLVTLVILVIGAVSWFHMLSFLG